MLVVLVKLRKYNQADCGPKGRQLQLITTTCFNLTLTLFSNTFYIVTILTQWREQVDNGLPVLDVTTYRRDVAEMRWNKNIGSSQLWKSHVCYTPHHSNSQELSQLDRTQYSVREYVLPFHTYSVIFLQSQLSVSAAINQMFDVQMRMFSHCSDRQEQCTQCCSSRHPC